MKCTHCNGNLVIRRVYSQSGESVDEVYCLHCGRIVYPMDLIQTQKRAEGKYRKREPKRGTQIRLTYRVLERLSG